MVERFREKYSVATVCEMFEVSCSGHYAWRNRQRKEVKDQWLIGLAMECQGQSRQIYDIRCV